MAIDGSGGGGDVGSGGRGDVRSGGTDNVCGKGDVGGAALADEGDTVLADVGNIVRADVGGVGNVGSKGDGGGAAPIHSWGVDCDAFNLYRTLSAVVEAVGRVKNYRVGSESNGDIMPLEPWFSQHQRIVSQMCDKCYVTDMKTRTILLAHERVMKTIFEPLKGNTDTRPRASVNNSTSSVATELHHLPMGE